MIATSTLEGMAWAARSIAVVACIIVFAGIVTSAATQRVIRIIDGDTFVIAGERIRIENIDAPEIHGSCPSEIAAAYRSKARLAEMLVDKPVALARTGADQYGRTIARVLVEGADVGEAMVAGGYARRWDGRRHPWC